MEPHSSDMKHKINEEKLFKQKVVQSAEAVRKKVKLIRDIKSNDNIMLEAMLKPITDPLSEMVKQNNNSNNASNLNISDTDFGNDRFKWNKSVKTLNYSPSEDGMKESLDNKTLLRKSTESNLNYSENELNDSDSTSHESDNQSDSDSTNNASFRTSDSYFSPREDPAWKKQYFNINIPFGVRNERGKLMLGSYPISVNDDKLLIGGESYFLTQGLNDLLFKKVPDLKLVTEDDKRSYKTLLLKTNAHRRDFDPNKPIKSNKGMKYLYVIKPLFKLSKQRTVSEELYVSGEGLPSMKKVKRDISYVYWDDPNELVERLKLLIASRDAGNTGLDNEIISIIEELREAGLTNII
ncbi:uncharacterized protein LOC133518923 [Cydia pomonella]|uniref:uncharacterized protein LOC133518923 n=1 Tax=Cydia pomonella TaxID=82600 RepID=UPI002ADE1B82|nr:uncharacterized protein LOC133518923 [Cydia pomonella]